MTTRPDADAMPSAEEKRRWAEELDATTEQIDEAIGAVGPRKADVELHLKGSRSTSNSDRVADAGA